MVDTHDVIPRADTAAPQSAILHPAVARMLEQSPTPDTLREILALQREWEKDQAKRSYTRALVELRRDLPAWIKRDQTVDFTGASGKRTHYTHASLAAALEAVLPALTNHGFSLAWTPSNAADGKVTVTATLTHRDGHSESASLSSAPDATGNKSGPQAVASTVTLLQRYTALSILGIATADMEEPKPNGNGEPAQTAGKVDTARNMRAMGDLAKAGKTRQDAEAKVGRPLTDWTEADLAALKDWIRPQAAKPATEPAEMPFEDDGKPAKHVDTAAVAIEYVTPEEVAVVKLWMTEFKLTAPTLGALIQSEFGQKPASLAKIPRTHFEHLDGVFAKVRKGEYTLEAGAVKRPPGEEEAF